MRRQGFTLPAVLAVVGVVTIVFLVAITALSSLEGEAAAARSRVAFTTRAMSAEARLTFLAITEPFGQRAIMVGAPRSNVFSDEAAPEPPEPGPGESRLFLDGRPYRIEDPEAVDVRVQDEAGQFNLAGPQPEALARLFRRLGVTAGFDRLVQVFQDYEDTDDLRKQDGGERESYPAGGPPNRPLRLPDELLNIRGVREAVDPEAWRRMRPHLRSGVVPYESNINTAPAEVLEIWFDLSPAEARQAIVAREGQAFGSIEAMGETIGRQLPASELPFTLPSGSVSVEIIDIRSPWRYRARLITTPLDPYRPFWVEQAQVSQDARGEATTGRQDVERFPDPAN